VLALAAASLIAGLDGGAPGAMLCGHVVARGTRKPLAVASVATGGDSASTETAVDGAFCLELSPGEHHVTVSAAAYAPRTFTEQLAAGTHLEVRYALDPRGAQAYETVVRDERERTEIARTSIEGNAMREVAGTGGDPVRVTLLMPGVSAPVSGVGYPIVRGSAPSATGYFIDGVRVPQLFHDFIGPAVVHPDLVDRIELISGGAPASYGRLLAGAVDAHVARPALDGPHAEAHADLTTAGAFAEHVLEKTGTAVTLAGRASYSGWLFDALSKAHVAESTSGGRLVADFWDYQARVEQPLLGGALRLFALGSSDTFGSTTSSDPTTTLLQTLKFHRVDLRYRHPLRLGELEAAATWGWDQVGFVSDLPSLGTSFRTEHALIRQISYSARLGWSAALGHGVSVSTGVTFDHVLAQLGDSVDQTFGGTSAHFSVQTPEHTANLVGVWAQLLWRPLERLSVTAGVRADAYLVDPDVHPAGVDPRLAVAWAESDALTVHAYGGLFHQAPSYIIPVPLADITTLAAGLQEVAQLGAGFTWRPWGPLEITADAYFNDMPRVIEVSLSAQPGGVVFNPTDPRGFTVPQATITSGRGYGVDLMVRFNGRGPFFGWLTLTAQRSVRVRTFPEQPGVRGSPMVTAEVPFTFDQTLVANAVAGVRFPHGFSAGVVLHFNTGAPESGGLGSSTLVPGSVTYQGQTFDVWQPVRLDQTARLPPYFRADVRASKTWLADRFSVELYLDLLNASLQPEVLGYAYYGGLGQPLGKTTLSSFVFVPTLGLRARY
jgi:hypothetical protein